MSEHQRLKDSVPAWALGAVEAGEAEIMRAHIHACPSCHETANRLGRTVDALALESDEVAPPERSRGRILAAAAALR